MEKVRMPEMDSDDQRCLRCGSFALDTGWECNDCGYDNAPHYGSATPTHGRAGGES